jgi:hypothetical protein
VDEDEGDRRVEGGDDDDLLLLATGVLPIKHFIQDIMERDEFRMRLRLVGSKLSSEITDKLRAVHDVRYSIRIV